MVLYALDDQGDIWWHAGSGWVAVPDGDVMPASTRRRPDTMVDSTTASFGE
jgi:hypothetical protein